MADPLGLGTGPPGLDLPRLRRYLDSVGFASGLALRAEVIEGGKSNLTYTVCSAEAAGSESAAGSGDAAGSVSAAGSGRQEWVLRRPPLGHVLATAHDMAREYRVLSALGSTAVPVPRTHLLCTDPDVLGAPFYVMQKVEGTVYRGARDTAVLSPRRAADIAYALMDVLADLHDVDPSSVGLADFGRPDGFLARQLRRWKAQLDASRSRPLPGIDELHSDLTARVPDSGSAAIVHGDYRLDNVIVGADDRVIAVLDWEMATLGDPLTDLGLFLVYWGSIAGLPGGALSSAVNPSVGFPEGTELIARYAARRRVDLSRLDWYVALGFFKLAVIAEGITYRFNAGQTVGAGFEHMGEVVTPLVSEGRAALARDASEPSF